MPFSESDEDRSQIRLSRTASTQTDLGIGPNSRADSPYPPSSPPLLSPSTSSTSLNLSVQAPVIQIEEPEKEDADDQGEKETEDDDATNETPTVMPKARNSVEPSSPAFDKSLEGTAQSASASWIPPTPTNTAIMAPQANSSVTESQSSASMSEKSPHLRPKKSKWARKAIANPEDGWDDETQPNGTVVEWGSGKEVVRRLALPSRLIQLRPPPNSSGQWTFAKTFVDGDFSACGKMEIGPYSRKDGKGSRDNTYMFYIIEGAVEATIHHSRYIIAPGGMFMVPRGNTYALKNISERPVKLAFFQARQTAAPAEDPLSSSHSPQEAEPPTLTIPWKGLKGTRTGMLLGLVLERCGKGMLKVLTRLMALTSRYGEFLATYLQFASRYLGALSERAPALRYSMAANPLRMYTLFFMLGVLVRARGRLAIRI
ncbi:Mif2/CENP-C like-domain-containing protein [Mycena floridula]|nr:Mif2/CENP-C like-domain-containing protein [Mycena floridula]KAJ7580599.1 Mif2/CENP-C like-domain-containing protein [Mycena floridula]